MKIFSGLKNHDPVTRQNAQGCFVSNLVMPGAGSLAGGRRLTGLAQLALSIGAFAITLVFGIRFIFWVLDHWSEFYGSNQDPDPMVRLRAMLHQVRWAFVGMGLFVFSWLWALLTSRSLLAKAKPPQC